MSLHIRILWGLLDPKDVPGDPPTGILEKFSAHCSAEEQLYNFRDPRSRELISPMLVKIGTSASITKRGKLATQVHLVEEHMLQYILPDLVCFVGALTSVNHPILCSTQHAELSPLTPSSRPSLCIPTRMFNQTSLTSTTYPF